MKTRIDPAASPRWRSLAHRLARLLSGPTSADEVIQLAKQRLGWKEPLTRNVLAWDDGAFLRWDGHHWWGARDEHDRTRIGDVAAPSDG